MTLGEKIKKLRIENGLTQKDLAERVHVTFQTVSKWEKDENEPDVSTLRELSRLFHCTMDYLLSEEGEEAPKPDPVVEVKEVPVIQKTVIVHQEETHVCARCGKDIPEAELVSEDIHRHVRHGKRHRSVSVGKTFYHKNCYEEVLKERKKAEKRVKAAKAAKAKKMSFGWGIAGGVVSLGIALALFLCNTQSVHPALGVLFSVLIGYGIFAMLYCIISGSYIGDVFLWCAERTVKFPALIFSWDMDGLAWLIVMKILFAILGFLAGVFFFLFAVAFSALLGGVSFPFVLVHNIHTGYADSLTH